MDEIYVICDWCKGSGESPRYSGKCLVCKGKGHVWIHKETAEKEILKAQIDKLRSGK